VEMMDNIRMSFFGLGACVVKASLSEADWQICMRVSKKLGCSLQEAIFDAGFFENTEVPFGSSWKEMGNVCKLSGMMSHYQSRIEIKVNNKAKRKILWTDLLSPNLLFPIYHTSIVKRDISDLAEREILIFEQEVGMLGRYEWEVEHFDLDKILFQIHQVKLVSQGTLDMVSGVLYDGKELLSVGADTLVKGQFALISEGGSQK